MGSSSSLALSACSLRSFSFSSQVGRTFGTAATHGLRREASCFLGKATQRSANAPPASGFLTRREAGAVLGSLLGGSILGWTFHRRLHDSRDSARTAAAVVRLASAVQPTGLPLRETDEGGSQVCVPPEVEAWSDFLLSRPGFVSLQVFVKDGLRSAAAKGEGGGEGTNPCELMLLERWESLESARAAEATALAENSSEAAKLRKGAEWPSRVYSPDSCARASLLRSLGVFSAGRAEARPLPH